MLKTLNQRMEQSPGLILRRNYRSHFEGYFLGNSLPKLVQILVREVLNWQVKPCENIWCFLNTCHFKTFLTHDIVVVGCCCLLSV